MENKKWTDADLRMAFEDGCKFLHFKDLQDFLLERRQNSENEQRNCNILHVINLSNCVHEWSFDTFDCYGIPLSKYCIKCGITEAI